MWQEDYCVFRGDQGKIEGKLFSYVKGLGYGGT